MNPVIHCHSTVKQINWFGHQRVWKMNLAVFESKKTIQIEELNLVVMLSHTTSTTVFVYHSGDYVVV
jgi:hypothetical protein